ncbi:MAG: cyclopropane-fatty-acyl-phospholipid synthase family protein [Gaiellaceae bacterium MAG52_C11]|nr:cyclopropane-fatty-acyl-phospholipid synthase family protein [Candidatus Gaiellasilicea maunaloa]
MSSVERSLRSAPQAARLPLLEQIAISILQRALVRLEGGMLEVRLPGGEVRHFGSGPLASLTIHDDAFFRRVATRGKLGVGESYTAGEWDSDDLVALLELLLRNAAPAAERHAGWRRLLEARPRLNRRNGMLRSRRNIAYHYDLGNDLFELMLDETMTYSCAVFERPDEPLADAQRRKYRRICERLRLSADDRVLEIGCGWGGFARFAATEFGCSVTGLTISAEQAALARERTRGLDVRILEEDYRRHEGSDRSRYTKVASIEMLEAIGEQQFGTYFETIDRLLEPGGIACIQTILIPDDRWERYRKSPDWIERYVFPGCLIPSLTALTQAMTSGSRLMVHEVDEIGFHYAETLRRWRESFQAQIEEVRALGYDRRFERTWDFYLAFCEAAFRTRALRDVQLTLTRPFNEALA